MGPCNSGYWSSPAASPVGANGRRRCGATQGRVPGGACSFPISVWSGTACLLNRLTRFARSCALLVPGIGKIHGQLLWSQEMWIKVAGRLGEALGHAWIFPTRPTSAAGFTRCVGGDFYMPRKRDPQNAYRARANIPTNSPDQLGTVILLIMKFSTPDFGPRELLSLPREAAREAERRVDVCEGLREASLSALATRQSQTQTRHAHASLWAWPRVGRAPSGSAARCGLCSHTRPPKTPTFRRYMPSSERACTPAGCSQAACSPRSSPTVKSSPRTRSRQIAAVVHLARQGSG